VAGPRPVATVVNHGDFLAAFSNAVLDAPERVIVATKASRFFLSTVMAMSAFRIITVMQGNSVRLPR